MATGTPVVAPACCGTHCRRCSGVAHVVGYGLHRPRRWGLHPCWHSESVLAAGAGVVKFPLLAHTGPRRHNSLIWWISGVDAGRPRRGWASCCGPALGDTAEPESVSGRHLSGRWADHVLRLPNSQILGAGVICCSSPFPSPCTPVTAFASCRSGSGAEAAPGDA